jgi:type VI protein secretion system component Hcp
MKTLSIKLICFLLFLTSFHVFSQSGLVLPYGIKVPEVEDLDQVVSPIEGMMVYSEQQKGLYLRKGSSWEILSEAVINSEAHIFVEIDGEVPDLYDEPVNGIVHTSESKVLEIDFNFYKKTARGASFADIKFKKKLGRTTLRIQRAVMFGITYPNVVFTFYVRDPTTSNDIPYYRYTFEFVQFLSDQIVGPHPELNTLIQDSPTRNVKSLVEEISLQFENMKVENLVDGTSFEFTIDRLILGQ